MTDSPDTRIASYRAAAATLGEIAQLDNPAEAYFRVAFACDSFDVDNDMPSDAISIIYDETLWRENKQGAAWVADAIRLRLLADALLMEQAATPTMARYGRHIRDGRDVRDEDLGTLVREWAAQASHADQTGWAGGE